MDSCSWPWNLAEVEELRIARLEILKQSIIFIVEVLLGLQGILHTSALLLLNLVPKVKAKKGGIDDILVAFLQGLETHAAWHGVQGA